VAANLSEELRFKRLASRGRSDDPKNIEDLKVRDNREIGFGVQEVIDKAEYQLSTEPSVEIVIKQARELVQKILTL